MHTFKVENMSCGGCAARITRAIQAVDPDAKVEVARREELASIREFGAAYERYRASVPAFIPGFGHHGRAHPDTAR